MSPLVQLLEVGAKWLLIAVECEGLSSEVMIFIRDDRLTP
jgi:hypothetical protein